MEEKRKHERFIIEGKNSHCKMLVSSELRLLNISISGAALSVSEKLNMGWEYTLELESEERVVSVSGVVVWAKMTELQKNDRGEMVPRYEVGMRFKDVFNYKGHELTDFIESKVFEKKFKVRLKLGC